MSFDESDQELRFPDGRGATDQPPWRNDFPIDWSEDHYVARRDYAKFLVLTSLAFFVGQLSIGFQSLVRRSRGQSPIRRVAAVADVPVGGVLPFQYPNRHDPCLLLRLDERTYVAYGQKCTHLSCAVVPRIDRGDLHCPCHVGSFDLATGRPLAGPPRRPLDRIVLELRGGSIYATAVQERTT